MKLICERELAENSEDHKNPLGTRYDNSINPMFNLYLTSLFRDRELNILDLGCSGGGFVKSCLDMGHNAVGIEGSDYSKKKQRAEWKTIPDSLFTADITGHVRFEDEGNRVITFDVITAWEVAEHLTFKELDGLATNIRNNLRMNGLAILSVANCSSKHNGIELHRTQKGKSWWITFFGSCGLYHQPHLIKHFNREWVRGKYEEDKGFHLILSTSPEDAPEMPSRRMLDELLYIWKGTIIYRAMKKVL